MKFQLYYPVKPVLITQKFGETAFLQYYKDNGVNFAGHNGCDLAAKHGQPVYASHDGVVEVQVDSKQGHGVVIRTQELFDYKDGEAYFKSIYWHLIDNIPVKTGDIVKAGTLIGYADSTGLSTGDHLHWGLKPMQKDNQGNFYNIENNDYMGAIDPIPYVNGKFAEDLNNVSTYIFSQDLEEGNRSDEVMRLQYRLQELGYFPQDQQCTGFYGSITQEAVFKFQLDHIPLTFWQKTIGCGKYFAQKTRAAINML